MSAEHLSEPSLDKARHIKYWTRCLKTPLPHHYTGNESNRMYLAFFILSALDLLDAWKTIAKADEKQNYIDWIYHCQHPDGGFRMWPGTDFGHLRNDSNAAWDPANIPATYFALSSLLVVGDSLERVNRKQTLDWIRKMQRDDGSFGETLVAGRIEGGRDPRFGYCATGIRYILRGDSEGPLDFDGVAIDDIDIDGLVLCIRRAESYDGGIADERFHEPHAGYEFCALGALNFVNRLNTDTQRKEETGHLGPSDPSMTIRWLVERQTTLEDPEEDMHIESAIGGETDATPSTDDVLEVGAEPVATSDNLHQSPDRSVPMPLLGLEPLEAGMNGRANKVADTCYAWWAGASFCMMQQPRLFSHGALQRYLLGKTQHPALGGFGKFPGDLPDLYHSYLGLAALGLIGVDGVKEIDASMCISKEASARLPDLWKAWREDL